MKKECSCLSIGHPEDGSIGTGDWSPHRSTMETKNDSNWTFEQATREGLFFGEPLTVSRSSFCVQPQQKSMCYSSSSIEMPHFGDDHLNNKPQHEIRFRCVSSDSSTTSNDHSRPNELNTSFPSMVCSSLETVQAGGIVGDAKWQLSRPKRRRNSSLPAEAFSFSEGRSMDEDDGACQSKPRKRRRTHERKAALDSSDFALILGQISR